MLSQTTLALCLMIPLVGPGPENPDDGPILIHIGQSTDRAVDVNLDADGRELVDRVEVSVVDPEAAGAASVDVVVSLVDRAARVTLASQSGSGVFRGGVSAELAALRPTVGEVLTATYDDPSAGPVEDTARMTTLCRMELVDLDLVPVTEIVPFRRLRLRLVDLDEPLTNIRLVGRVRVFEPIDLNGDGRIEGSLETNWMSDTEAFRLVPVDTPEGRYFLSQPFHVNSKGQGLFERGDLASSAATFLSVLRDPNVRWNLKCALVGKMIEMLNAIVIAAHDGDPIGLGLPQHVCGLDEIYAFLAPESLDQLEVSFADWVAQGRSLSDMPIPNNRLNITPGIKVVVDHMDPDEPDRDRCTYEVRY